MIEIKSEVGELRENAATDCKWVWVHKGLICILCSTLMALWLLKYAHQAGNIWIAHNDVEIYGLHCLDFGQPIACLSSKHTIAHICELKLLCGSSVLAKKPICKSLYATLSYNGYTAKSISNDSGLNIYLTMPEIAKYMTQILSLQFKENPVAQPVSIRMKEDPGLFAELLLNELTFQHAESNVRN